MITFIASVLGQNDHDYESHIKSLLENNAELLTRQEKSILQELLEDFKITGTFSHPDRFKRENPDIKQALDMAKKIDKGEFKHYILNLLETRRRQSSSKVLMEVAQEVLDKGLSYDDLERIRSLPLAEDSIEEEEELTFQERYMKRKEQSLGIQTGILEIDNVIGGIPQGFLAVLFAWTASYKCCSKDTLIDTNRGFMTIEQVYEYSGGLLVKSEHGYRKIKQRHYEGVKDSIKVSVAGRKMEVSPVHRFRVYRHNKWIWVPAKKLALGDKVRVSMTPSFNNKGRSDLDKMYAYGMLIGVAEPIKTGLRIRKQVECCVAIEDILVDRYKDFIKEDGSKDTCVTEHKEADLIRKMILLDRELPREVWRTSKEGCSYLLAGLFDTVGFLRGSLPAFRLETETLAQQTAQLLLKFGILTEVDYTEVRVLSSKSVDRFLKEIPFKDHCLRDRIKNKGTYPKVLGVKESIIKILSNTDKMTPDIRSRLGEGKEVLGLGVLEDLTEEYPELLKSKIIRNTLENEWVVQEVTSLEKGKVEMYDLTVQGSPTYLIAGCVTHNTTTAVNMLYNNSYKNGFNQVYISLEVPKDDLYYNLLCRHSNDPKFSKFPFLYHDRIRKGMLSEEEEKYLFDVIHPDLQESKGKMIILDETDFNNFSFGEIQTRLEEVDDETPGGIDVVYWDHANLFKFSSGALRNLPPGEVINRYISFIRRLSIRFRRDKENSTEWRKLANVVLAQANRDGWRRAVKNGGRYSLTALSEANELERASSFVISLFTTEDMKISKEASAQLLKSRYGQTIYDPINIYADPERYIIGGEESSDQTAVSESMFDTLLDINPTDMGFSGDLDLSEFDV